MPTPIYSSAVKLAAYLQVPDFDATTTPNVTTIQDFLLRAERYVEIRTQRAYGGKVVKITDAETIDYEYHDTGPPWTRYNPISFVNKPRIHLRHPNVVTPLSAASGDSLQVFDSDWVEWVGVKTEGRKNDFWINADEGIVYFNQGLPIYRHPDGVRIRYRFSGPSSLDPWVEDTTTKLAAIMVMEHWKQFAFTTPELAKADINKVISDLRDETEKILTTNRFDSYEKRPIIVG